MKKQKKKPRHRFTLSLIASLAVFFVILIAIVVGAELIYIMTSAGIIFSLDGETDLWRILLFLGAVSAIVGFGLTILLSRLLLRPINRILKCLNRLASGDFKARLRFGKPIGLHPTIAEICDSFNKMAEELENTQMLRSDFINNFSHEFKTPIVSVAGFAKLLKRGNLTEEQRTEYLDIIEKESLRLSTMATNVLSMTKVENQAILTDSTRFNLSEQLRSSILLLEVKWSRKNIEFNIDFGEYTITAGEELLMQVWINLIDNAIKFSPDGGTIDIDIRESGGMITVSVKNTGCDIPQELHKRIFDKFYQADESHSAEGSGIGLALVKRITELHNGTVSVRSENGATVFTVTLPKAPPNL